jgi:hypothetical protein
VAFELNADQLMIRVRVSSTPVVVVALVAECRPAEAA